MSQCFQGSRSSDEHDGLKSTADVFVYFPIDHVKKVETDAGLHNELQVPLVYPSKTWKKKVGQIGTLFCIHVLNRFVFSS